jgi:hypothetical protein
LRFLTLPPNRWPTSLEREPARSFLLLDTALIVDNIILMTAEFLLTDTTLIDDDSSIQAELARW